MTPPKALVFGTGQLSSLAWYCLSHDSPYRVVAFTVDRAFLRAPTHEGLPVVAMEALHERYPPGSVHLCIPLGHREINGLRRRCYELARTTGYEFLSYVSSRALVWPDLRVGANVLIHDGAIIQPFTSIGNNVVIRSGAHISHHNRIADHAFIAAGAMLGGDVAIGEQAFIGLGAVVRDGVRIAERSFIGAGAVVVADTEADAVYVGNPARKLPRSALDATT